MHRPRVLFFVEGFTDIRFVVGLSSIADLTMCVPSVAYADSGLRDRVEASGARLRVHEVPGRRLGYQVRSLAWLWRNAIEYDAILSQELLRGSLNATVIGALRRVPVLTTMMIAPVEYFRCRRERQQIGAVASLAGETVIRVLMTVTGRLSTKCIALGEYLEGIARAYCPRTTRGGYYGVDTTFFAPATPEERLACRRQLGLPEKAFLIFLASRISHEKDPETVLRATALLRARGVDAVLLNLSGGYREFLSLSRSLGLGSDVDQWVIGRPPAHPMTELASYFRAADCTAQASHAEGLGLSPLESLSCGVPVVATRVGGMAVTLDGFARLVPPRSPEGMADAFLWVASHYDEARAQAMRGRAMVQQQWSREKTFADLARVLDETRRHST